MTDQHAEYLALLAKWNRTINLTSLNVDPPDAAAIERLINEPVSASALIEPTDTLAVDLGSGGGSPALPLKIACPWLRFVLVESRVKKCAFLREAVRELALENVEVQHCRFEQLRALRPDLAGAVDVVTFRAVRADAALWALVTWLLKPRGKVVWFGGTTADVPGQFTASIHWTVVLAHPN